MALYRCSACGSPNVITETQKDGGYSFKKGLFGALLFGGVGAVAGINGKTKQVFKCPDCGQTMDAPMPEEVKLLIDLGVDSLDARNNLILRGTKIDWEVLTKRHRNIESGRADRELQELNARKEAERTAYLAAEAAKQQAFNPNDGESIKQALLNAIPPMPGLLTKEQIVATNPSLASVPDVYLEQYLKELKSACLVIVTRDKYRSYYTKV